MSSLIEDNWIITVMMHLICYDITQHEASGKMYCAFISERK